MKGSTKSYKKEGRDKKITTSRGKGGHRRVKPNPTRDSNKLFLIIHRINMMVTFSG
jgi:hypothetical protein